MLRDEAGKLDWQGEWRLDCGAVGKAAWVAHRGPPIARRSDIGRRRLFET